MSDGAGGDVGDERAAEQPTEPFASGEPTDEQVSAAARALDIPETCIRARLLLGWRPHDALTKPPRRRQGFVLRSWKWLDRTSVLDHVKQQKEKP